MKKINQILFFLLIFFLPTQLGKHFFLPFSYLSGVRVDYLAPTVYLTDVIIFLLLIINFKTVLNFFKNKKILIGLALLLVNLAFSKLPQISIYWIIKTVEFFIVISLVKKMLADLKDKYILVALLSSGIFELILTLMQFINKHSIQGIFYYFGERLMTLSTPGIANASFNGIEFLRPYGTFSHPNSLAGFFLVLYFFVLTYKKFNRYLTLKYLFLLVASFLVFISFSKVTIITYSLLTIIYFLISRKLKCRICVIARILILAIITIIFSITKNDPLTISKRIELLSNSMMIIFRHPLTGVGLGSYLIEQAKYPSKYYLFFNQPVHNIFMLFLSELGFLLGGLIILLSFPTLKRIFKLNPYFVLAIIFTGLFDHYWLTLEQNFLLMGLIMGVILFQSKLSGSDRSAG